MCNSDDVDHLIKSKSCLDTLTSRQLVKNSSQDNSYAKALESFQFCFNDEI